MKLNSFFQNNRDDSNLPIYAADFAFFSLVTISFASVSFAISPRSWATSAIQKVWFYNSSIKK